MGGVTARKAKRRKKAGEAKLAFDPGRVFDVEPANDLDELDALTRKELRAFKARKGEGGNRGQPDGFSISKAIADAYATRLEAIRASFRGRK